MATASIRGRPLDFLALDIDASYFLAPSIGGPIRCSNTEPALTANSDPEEIEMLTADFAHTTPCPVMPLAIEAVRLVNQMNRYDGVAFDLYDAALERLSQVELCAIDQRARSQGGLFFQACLAYSAADSLFSWVPGELQANARPMRHEIEGATLSLSLALVVDELAVLADHYLPRAVAAQVAA